MAWFILVTSAIFEAVWATALGMSNGLTELVPVIVFIIGSIVSMAGLAYAMKCIPVGTAYAVWTGIGAALTVVYAVATGTETMSVWRAIFLFGIIGSVIGLKLFEASEEPEGPEVLPEELKEQVQESLMVPGRDRER